MHGFPSLRRSDAGAKTMSAAKRTAESRPVAAAPDDGLLERRGPALTVPQQAAPRRIRRGWLVRRALLAADVFGLLVAFFVTELLFADNHVVGGVGTGSKSAIFVASLAAWAVIAKLYGLYDRDEERATHSTADEVVSVFHLITVGVWLFFATSWLVGLTHPNQAKLATFWLLALVCVAGLRSVARGLARRNPAYVQNAVIVGAGDVGQLIGRKLLHHPEYRINLLGFVDATPKEMRGDLEATEVLGEPDEIGEIVRRADVDRVIVAFSRDEHEEMLALVRALRKEDVQIDVVPRLFEAVGPGAPLHAIEGLPLLGLAPARMSRSTRLLKRSLDLAAALILLALCAPLMLLIAILVRRDSPGGVFFRQPRLGMD